MKIDVVKFRELPTGCRQRWSELCERTCAPLDSPFYRPEFAEIIDQARGDVEVAVAEEAGQVVALMPFHRFRGRVGKSVGLHLNDFQGMVGTLPTGLFMEDLARGCGLNAFDFDHVPIEQTGFSSGIALTDPSPLIDLAGGYEAYAKGRNEKSNDLRDSARRQRKLEREHGDVRVEHDIKNEAVLEQLLAWKQQQFVRTAVPDVLSDSWVRESVGLMATYASPQFSGVLSGLWAGDRLVAAELGPRSGHVYHLQWCAYDPDYQAYSPGRLLNESVIRWCAANGVSRIEYGKGDQDYKLRAATGQHLVATGSIAAGTLQRAVRSTWWALRRWARGSRLRPHLKAAASYYFRLRGPAPQAAKDGA